MILGVGTDIVRVERIRRLLEKYPHFVDKVFTEDEIRYCSERSFPEQAYAVRFAAKEAVMKALGTGWSGKTNWQDIEVIRDVSGKPDIALYNSTKELMQELRVTGIHCSLSHERDFAVAFVVLETEKT